MLYQTTLDNFKRLAQQTSRVVVYRQFYLDTLTPISILQSLAKEKSQLVMLDNSNDSDKNNPVVFIGREPVAEFQSNANRISITINQQTHTFQGEAYIELKQFYIQNRFLADNHVNTLAGGMTGYLSYEAARLFEDIPNKHSEIEKAADIDFKFYRQQIIIEKQSAKMTVALNVNIDVDVDVDVESCFFNAVKEIDGLIKKIIKPKRMVTKKITPQAKNKFEMLTDTDDVTFCQMVEKAKEYIKSGDVFQVVLSREFKTKYYGNTIDIYRALNLINPSPYQFYLRHNTFTLVGSSPERLVECSQSTVKVTPIAGTRLRAHNPDQDDEIENELLNDGKEIAEHMMLVDLARNDIGTVCVPGSVEVSNLKKIHKFSRVMHIVSQVKGKLEKKYDAFDVLKANFPAGTLSGAPKIRAMGIINGLENSNRGIYGGGLCVIDRLGQLDSCIIIRSAMIENHDLTVRAGAGIVYDSIAQKEADETRHKAQAIFDAIALATEGVFL